MNYTKPFTIKDKVNKILKDKKHPIYSLPHYETLKDIFIEFEDDKKFFINVVNDINSQVESEMICFHEMKPLQPLDYDPMFGEYPSPNTSMEFQIGLTMTAVENRYSIRKEPKILTLSPNPKKYDVGDICSMANHFKNFSVLDYYQINEEIDRAKEYLRGDFKRIIFDNKNGVIIILFNSYECQKIK